VNVSVLDKPVRNDVRRTEITLSESKNRKLPAGTTSYVIGLGQSEATLLMGGEKKLYKISSTLHVIPPSAPVPIDNGRRVLSSSGSETALVARNN
jgi:hypothetical protein